MMKVIAAASLVAMMASPVLAQTSPTPSTTPAAPAGRVAPDARSSAAPADVMMMTEDSLATKIIGTPIRSATNENIGDINDLVVDSSGKVKAVIAGIGGFLGLGEHRVMLRYDQMQFNRDSNGKLFIVSQMSRDQLKALPAWKDTAEASSPKTK